MSEELSKFAPILADIATLTRNHLLFYRVSLGRLLLHRFYAGSAHVYQDKSYDKEQSFNEFHTTCAEQLHDFGLGVTSLRNAINCSIVFDGLPEQVRAALGYTLVVELTRVGDPTTRAQLAKAAVDGGWHVRELRLAIAQFKDGNWYDTQAEAPGTQPPPAHETEAKRPQPGRLATQAERWLGDVDTWAAQWTQVAPAKVTKAQRLRIVEAVTATQARLAVLAKALAKG